MGFFTGLFKLLKELLYIGILFGCGFITGVLYREPALDQFVKSSFHQFLSEFQEHIMGAERAKAYQLEKIKALQAIEKEMDSR